MRLWMLPPWIMCDKHILGEHVECHMFTSHIIHNRNIQGYLANGLLEIHSLIDRHDELVEEMTRRGFNHKTPIDTFTIVRLGSIDRVHNFLELMSRCERCKQVLINYVKENLGG
jgi:hypothetical protein